MCHLPHQKIKNKNTQRSLTVFCWIQKFPRGNSPGFFLAWKLETRLSHCEQFPSGSVGSAIPRSKGRVNGRSWERIRGLKQGDPGRSLVLLEKMGIPLVKQTSWFLLIRGLKFISSVLFSMVVYSQPWCYLVFLKQNAEKNG